MNKPSEVLIEEQRHAVVAIRREDGTVQTVIAWIALDPDGNLVLSTVEGRTWLENLRRAGQATVTVVNFSNPGEYVSITTELASTSHDDAVDVINDLSNRVLGIDFPLLRDDEQRVTVRLVPTRFTYTKMG